MTETTARVRARWPAWIAWIPGLVVLGGLVWVVATHLSEERELVSLLTRARPRWLIAAALLQAATYLSVGETWRLPLHAAGHTFSRWLLARLALIELTLDQAVPTGGMSGAVFMSRRLKRLGVSGAALAATMLIVLAGYYLAYALAVAGAVAVLWLYHDLNAAVAGLASAFAVLAAGLPLALLWSVRRNRGKVPKRLRRLRWLRRLLSETALASPDLVNRKLLVLGSATGSFVTMVLDSLTLAVTLLAVGAPPNVLTCFAALVFASVASTIGFMPGGLGTFEAGSVAVLTVTGTDAASALAATLLLRGFTFWLPMIPGVVLMRLPRRGEPAPVTRLSDRTTSSSARLPRHRPL